MQDRVVVITGALGALGTALVERFADSKLVLVDKAAAQHPPSPGERHLWLTGVDLSETFSAQAVISAAAERFGCVDVVVNTAGTFRWEKVVGGSAAVWDDLYRVNFRTAYNMCRAAAPHLSAGAAIVNVGAHAALHAREGMGAYAASKSAVHRLTESLAAELKPRIAVTAVLPTIIDTQRNRADMPDADFSQWVTPAEVADVIAFLAGSAARVLSGVLLPVMR